MEVGGFFMHYGNFSCPDASLDHGKHAERIRVGKSAGCSVRVLADHGFDGLGEG